MPRMEKRSARILAFVLALIMIGSVFAYVMRGGTQNKREVKEIFSDFRDYINITPKSAYLIEYVNLSYLYLNKDDPLREYIDHKLKNILRPEIFSRSIISFPNGFRSIVLAYCYDTVQSYFYFVDTNLSKVYFAYNSELKIGNYTVKVRPGIALLDEISPVVVGYIKPVSDVVEILEGNETGLSEYHKYLSRINGSFLYAWYTYGDYAKSTIKANNSSMADFFFEGYRFNETNKSYEKVWALHFIGNYFFAKTNKTEYCYIRSYDDGFSVAVLGDKNFTKLMKTNPRILMYQIKIGS